MIENTISKENPLLKVEIPENITTLSILINNEIGRSVVNKIINDITNLINQKIPINGQWKSRFQKIYLAISTPGGSVQDGLFLFNFLKSLKNVEIITHNVGMCDSIGAIIFLAGKKRYMSSHSSFLIHGVSLPMDGIHNKNSIQETLNSLNQIEETLIEVYKKNTNLQDLEVNKIFSVGIRYNSKTALDKGIITEIREYTFIQDSLVLSY